MTRRRCRPSSWWRSIAWPMANPTNRCTNHCCRRARGVDLDRERSTGCGRCSRVSFGGFGDWQGVGRRDWHAAGAGNAQNGQAARPVGEVVACQLRCDEETERPGDVSGLRNRRQPSRLRRIGIRNRAGGHRARHAQAPMTIRQALSRACHHNINSINMVRHLCWPRSSSPSSLQMWASWLCAFVSRSPAPALNGTAVWDVIYWKLHNVVARDRRSDK